MHKSEEDPPYDLPPQIVEEPDGTLRGVKYDELAERRRLKALERRNAHPLFDIWKKWGMQLSDTGGPIPNLRNAVSILQHDPKYKDQIWFDEFLNRILVDGREWRESDDIGLALHIQGEIGITRIGADTVRQAVIVYAHENKKNCVREWISGLTHDGTNRIEHFFCDHMGADQSDYAFAASKNFWLSLVARAMTPGCKVDNMIVLEGNQGVGKSRALQIIGREWFAEQHESATNPKAFAEVLQGKLIVEISEMDAFNRAEVNRVKQTISCSSDRFRASYGRYASDHPRTCIFVGTTNRDDWNRDETGARRFWPIACRGLINLSGIADNRDQLLAEAACRLKKSEPYWEMPYVATRDEQRSRYQHDSWFGEVDRIIRGRNDITTHEILIELGVETARQGRSEQMRVAAILRFLGWQKSRKRTKDERLDRPYVYHRPDKGEDTEIT